MVRNINSFRRPKMLFFMVIGCAVAFLGWMGSVFARPFMKAADMERENQRLERQAMELKLKQQELRKLHAVVATDSGMEREARRAGYIKNNEVPLIIPEPGPMAKP